MVSRLLLLIIVACTLFAGSKRDWREGKIVKVESENIVEGTHAERFYYTIDIGLSLLIATDNVVWRWQKPTQLSEGDAVKWAMHKHQVCVTGPDGIEHTLTIRRKDAKTAP